MPAISGLLWLACAGLTVLAWRSTRQISDLTSRVQQRANRHYVLASEQIRLRESRSNVNRVSTTAETAVTAVATVAQTGHLAIAAIPFEVLAAIPGARKPAKLVREVHDNIADGVYESISALNKNINAAVRRAATGTSASSTDEQPLS
jgi:hypothetical protein